MLSFHFTLYSQYSIKPIYIIQNILAFAFIIFCIKLNLLTVREELTIHVLKITRNAVRITITAISIYLSSSNLNLCRTALAITDASSISAPICSNASAGNQDIPCRSASASTYTCATIS